MTTETMECPPSMRPIDGRPLVRVYVWDVVVRITHWLTALSLVELSVTGLYIGNPYIVSPGPAGDHFIMGWMKALHFYGAIVFTLSVLARIAWLFLANNHAGWRSFIPTTKKRLDAFLGTLAFYVFLRDRPPHTRGHNPVAGFAYALVFLLCLVPIVSGMGLYGMSAEVGSFMAMFGGLVDWFGGAQMARWYHHVSMWLLIGFFVHHLYSAILMTIVEKNGTIESIFSGYKWIKDIPDEDVE